MFEKKSIFTSPEGEEAYLAAYEAMFDLWPVAHEGIDVETRFGRTHINASGPEDASPLLLLHAAGFSSTAWYANIGALSRNHRAYVVDIIGDAEKSRINQRLRSWEDHADWLNDVLDGLSIERADIIGHSQGGWMAMALALKYPQKVNKLVLLAPAASIHPFAWFVKLSLALAGRMIRPSARSQLKIAAAKGAILEDRLVHMMEMVTKHCLPATMVPAVYSDDELKSIDLPTLLLIGDQEKIYNSKKAMQRASQLMPDVTAEIIANASHLLITEQPALINARILDFLAQDGGDTPLNDRSSIVTSLF